MFLGVPVATQFQAIKASVVCGKLNPTHSSNIHQCRTPTASKQNLCVYSMMCISPWHVFVTKKTKVVKLVRNKMICVRFRLWALYVSMCSFLCTAVSRTFKLIWVALSRLTIQDRFGLILSLYAETSFGMTSCTFHFFVCSPFRCGYIIGLHCPQIAFSQIFHGGSFARGV